MYRIIKKITVAVLCVLLSISVVQAPNMTAEAHTMEIGDVNNSGGIDATDALTVLKHVVKLSLIPDNLLSVADVNFDETIDASDALSILKYVVRLIDNFSEVAFIGKVDVYSISQEKYVRSCNAMGDLSELGSDEYFTFCLNVQYNGDSTYEWESAYVTVDGGEPWYWGAGQLPAKSRTNFHIYYVNMKNCMTQGVHTVDWYFDGQKVHSQQFLITKDMNWNSVFKLPTKAEIASYKNPNNSRSPYISGWYYIPKETRYTEYVVDFKADHVPKGTYCSLGNWYMDYSSLEKQYVSVQTEDNGIHAYAGFQKIYNGDMVSIMSFWDVYCKDAFGKETVIRAKRVYPKTIIGEDNFGGEGTGARSIVPYEWEPNHWYRMHLRCVTSQETGNTVVEQWVCDLETGKYTLQCSFDVGVKNSAFKGSIAVFLENYLTEYAGEVRSMEVCNAMYLDADANQWVPLKACYFSSMDGSPAYEGSYDYGVFENRFWMITSGVGGDWFNNGKGKQGMYLYVN